MSDCVHVAHFTRGQREHWIEVTPNGVRVRSENLRCTHRGFEPSEEWMPVELAKSKFPAHAEAIANAAIVLHWRTPGSTPFLGWPLGGH